MVYLQTHYRTPTLDKFFTIVTMFIDPAVVMVSTMVLLIISKNKEKASTVVLFILINTFFTGVLKTFYADPRPFWESSKVVNIGLYCPQEYGNPSGHSWFSVVLIFGIAIETFGKGRYYWKFIVGVIFLFLVPTSRFYLGAHSLNQIIQGLSLGFAMTVLYLVGDGKKYLKFFLYNFSSSKRLKLFVVFCNVLYLGAYYFNSVH